MPRLSLFAAACLAAVLTSAGHGAHASEPPAMTPRLVAGQHFLTTWRMAATECMCRANGSFYHEGELTCIRGINGPRLARCSKVINMLHWETTEAPCPQS